MQNFNNGQPPPQEADALRADDAQIFHDYDGNEGLHVDPADPPRPGEDALPFDDAPEFHMAQGEGGERGVRDKRRRTLLIALSAVLGAALIAVSVYAYNLNKTRAHYENYVSALYEKSFEEIISGFMSLEMGLSKALIVSTQGLTVSELMELSRQADVVQDDIGQLPSGLGRFEGWLRVTNQTADFCRVMAEQVAYGNDMDDDQRGTLAKLRDHCVAINIELKALRQEFEEKKFTWISVVMAKAGSENYYGGEEGTLWKLEQANMDYPTMLYDGPFSYALEQPEPKNDWGEEIDEAAAKDRLWEMLAQQGVRIEPRGEIGGRLPCWQFEYETPAGLKGVADVLKKGGMMLLMTANRAVEGPALSDEQAYDKATEYLAAIGYADMEPNYFERSDGIMVINFAAVDNDVVMYPDLIKVKIALDDGTILGIDARNYLLNHVDRDIPEPQVTDAQAADVASRYFDQPGQARLCVIPTEGGKERLCWEVKGASGEQTFLIYVDAESGAQVQVFRIVDTPDGQVAI